MADLLITPLPLDRFIYNKLDGTLVAEASDFGPSRNGRGWLQRLYDDAADVGIAILSQTTGRVERFYLIEEHVDRDGDLTHWEFEPCNKKLSTVKRVIIFND